MTTRDHHIHHRHGILIAEMAVYDPHTDEAASRRTLLGRFGFGAWRATFWRLRGRGNGSLALEESSAVGLPKNSA